MVKPTVFSVESDPKKDKSTDVHLIPVKEMPYKSSFDDDQPLVTSGTEVCTLQRCACALLLMLIGLGCLIGAGVGLYIHLSHRVQEPTLILTEPGHPYGNDALYPPDFHRPGRVGGDLDYPEFHHGSRDHAFRPIRPRPPFPGPHPPFMERPFGPDAFEPPVPDVPAGENTPHKGHHERPHGPPPGPRGPLGPLGPHAPPGPNGRRFGPGGPHKDHGLGPEYEIHHGGPEIHAHGRHRGKASRDQYHGSLP